MSQSQNQTKNRIFIVDDHPLVREWLTNLINQQGDLEICGEAGDAPSALGGIEKLRPDVAIVDITLTSGSGLELVKDIKQVSPDVACIVLSMHDEVLYAERALRAGAQGYVTKRDTTKKIIAAIRAVLSGELFISEDMKVLLTRKFIARGSERCGIEGLSDRELEVFEMLGSGIETRGIAESLNISMKTVQVYCPRIKEKFHIESATELRREAVRWLESRGQT